MSTTTEIAASPLTVQPVAESQSLLRKLRALFGWRVLTMAASAAGNIWAARCLGPDKLGLSATVQAVTAQLILFTHFGQNNFLIRRFKHLDEASAQRELSEDVIVLRFVTSVVITAVGLGVLFLGGLSPAWYLPVAAGTVLFLLEAQTTDWLLQAQENQTAIYRSALWGAVLCGTCYFLFLRPGAAAGSNLVVACAGALVVRVLTYRAALAGTGRLHPKLRYFRRAVALAWEGRLFFATALVTLIYTQGEQLLVAYFRPMDEMGIYKSSLQLTGAAVPLFTIITSLLYPRFIEWRKLGAAHLWQRQRQLGVLSLSLWVVAALLVVPAVHFVYPVVFGPQFAGGALPCALLILSKALVVPVSIFVFSLWAHGRDGLMLLATSITALLSLALNLTLIPRYGIIAAAAANLFSEVIMLAFGVHLSRRLSREETILAVRP